jgi:hypothetical protein
MFDARRDQATRAGPVDHTPGIKSLLGLVRFPGPESKDGCGRHCLHVRGIVKRYWVLEGIRRSVEPKLAYRERYWTTRWVRQYLPHPRPRPLLPPLDSTRVWALDTKSITVPDIIPPVLGTQGPQQNTQQLQESRLPLVRDSWIKHHNSEQLSSQRCARRF